MDKIGLHFLYKVVKEFNTYYLMHVNEDFFIYEDERQLYNYIKTYLQRYNAFPTIEPPEKFTDEPFQYYLDRLYKRYLLSVMQSMSFANLTEDNVEKMAFYLQNALEKAYIVQNTEIITEDILKEEVEKTLDYLSEFYTKHTIPSYYPTIDNITNGYIKGEIFVYAGRLKQGKTMYLLNSMRKVAKKYKTLFITMEMSVRSIIRRLLFLEYKNKNYLQPKEFISPEERELISKTFNFNLSIAPNSVIKDISSIRYLIRFIQPEIVFIDGAYLIATQYGRAEWERIKYLVEELKRIALAFDVPIVTTFQLNREAKKSKEIDEIHIALSDAIAQSAGVVVAIHDKECPPMLRKCKILVNREGMANIEFNLNFDWENADFDELTFSEMPYPSEEVKS